MGLDYFGLIRSVETLRAVRAETIFICRPDSVTPIG